MSTNSRHKELFEKYINDQCSKAELREFFELLKNDSFNSDFFDDNVPIEKIDLDDKKSEIIFQRIIGAGDSKARKSTRFPLFFKVAAIFIGFILGGYMLYYYTSKTEEPLSGGKANQFVVLEQPNGKKHIFKGSEEVLTIGNGDTIGLKKGNTIKYTRQSKALEFNTIHVPAGQKFELSLADGSRVYLNAGTSLKYPLNFDIAENRRVYLKGEAFFDVSTDTNHPFIVQVEDLNVKVFGTEFNVSSYSEDANIDIVLVEGSVGMYVRDNNANPSVDFLKPNYKASFNKKKRDINKELVNTMNYTSWRFGKLLFRNISFKNLLIKLERHFDVKFINHNNSLSGKMLNANFGEAALEEIMEYLKSIYDLKYAIKNKTIIIE